MIWELKGVGLLKSENWAYPEAVSVPGVLPLFLDPFGSAIMFEMEADPDWDGPQNFFFRRQKILMPGFGPKFLGPRKE